MELYHLLALTLIVLMMTTWWREKRPWEEATLLSNSCSTLPYLTLRSFPSKCLILLLQVLILLRDPTTSYGAQIQETSLKTFQQSVCREITSTHLCKYKESGLIIKKPSAQLTPQEEEPMKQQPPTSRKRMAFYMYTKCVPTGMGIPTTPCWTY